MCEDLEETASNMTPTRPLSPHTAAADPGLQRLAGAVLIQALEDLSRGPRRSREQALEWMLGKITDGFSFELCCSLLGRDREDVLQRVQRYFFIPNNSSMSHVSSREALSCLLE